VAIDGEPVISDTVRAMTEAQLPPRLQDVVEDFALAEGREKLELLMQYGQELPPLPENLQKHRDQMDPVPECMSPVFAQAAVEDGRMRFFLDVPEEAPTVRGFAAILQRGLDGETPDAVLAVPGTFYEKMGLTGLLSHQRLNGMRAILAKLKGYAKAAKDAEA